MRIWEDIMITIKTDITIDVYDPVELLKTSDRTKSIRKSRLY